LLEPDPRESASRRLTRRRSKLTLLDELHDLLAERGIGIGKAREGPVEEALAEAGQRPGSGVLQGRGPVAVEVACPHRVVEESLPLEARDRPPGERLAGAGMPCPEVDDLEAVGLPSVGQDDESIRGPYLVPSIILSIADAGRGPAPLPSGGADLRGIAGPR